MNKKTTLWLVVSLFGCLLAGNVSADPAAGETASTEATKEFKVGTKVSPPFSFKDERGQWKGAAIDLWDQVANQLGIKYQIHEEKLSTMLEDIKAGKLDAIVMNLSTTVEREKFIDFTHPYYVTGLGIAAKSESSPGLSQILGIFSGDFLAFLGYLLGVALIIGIIIWLVERRANPESFGSGGIAGIGSGLWFAIVTMTTVGYGDKAPTTMVGRILTSIWMFVGMIFIAFFTAFVTSALTVQSLGGTIKGPEDLVYARVGTVSASTGQKYLESKGYRFSGYDSVQDGLKAIADNKLDAFVFDIPIMEYIISKDYGDKLLVLPNVLQREDFAIGLSDNPEFQPINAEINTAIIEKINSGQWQTILERYTKAGGR